jgi:putative FmdB family regulatory protein
MPTYQYLCKNCGYEFEKFQSITTKPLRKCPKCNKSTVKRLIGAGAGVIFKGAGFYATDYRSEGYKKAIESEKKTTTKKEAEPTDKEPKPDKPPKSAKGDKKSSV